MARNRELDDAAMNLLILHQRAVWRRYKVNMRRRVKLMKTIRNERKQQKLLRLHIKYKLKELRQQVIKQTKESIKQLIKQTKLQMHQLDEQAFENCIQDECRKSALTAPAWVSANKKEQARALAIL